MAHNEVYRRHLKWQMRRGLLELDIVMRRFIADGFDDLNDAQLKQLEVLLALPDPVLLAMVCNRREPDDRTLLGVVNRLREAALKS